MDDLHKRTVGSRIPYILASELNGFDSTGSILRDLQLFRGVA